MIKSKYLPLTVLTLAMSYGANAEIRINGFANIVGGITGSDETFLGFTDKVSFDKESLFALQLSGDVSDKLTATGQIVARGENNYSGKFEWAYIAYEYSDNTTITAGRFRLPLFTYSASKDIGYSYHWISPPSTVYNVPFTNLDGIKIDYANYSGDWEYNLSLSYGQFEALVNKSTVTTGDNTVLVSGEAITGNFKFRGVYGRADAGLDTSTSSTPAIVGLGGAIDAIEGLGLTELADNLRFEDDPGFFMGASFQYDNYDWFFATEVTSTGIDDTFTSKDDSFYVTLGKRMNKWTPSITFQNLVSKGEVKYSDQIAELAMFPLPADISQALVGAAIGSQLSEAEDYDILSFTLRYELDNNIALKADISKLSDNLDDANDATSLRFAINYVF